MNNLTKEQFLHYASIFNSPNMNERNEAYEAMELTIKNKPQLFTDLSLDCLQDQQIQEGPLRIILTLLIRALKNGSQEHPGKSIWLSIDKQTKDQLLQCSFSIVLHDSSQIKKQGADLISTIFCLDRINEQLWPNIIDSISKNVSHSEQGVREAAIYSLSYICEYTQDNSNINLSTQEIECLLSGIFNTIKQFSPLTIIAVDGLKYATDFVLQRMHENEKFDTSDYVFNILIDLLIKCKQNPNLNNEDLISGIIICLKDICEGFYKKLENYKDVIFDKVLNSLTLSPKIINAVFFFFQGIFEMEYIEQTNLTLNIYQKVKKAVFEFLLTYKQLHFDDEGGSSLTDASFQLLKSINKLYIQEENQDNLNFVYTNIEIQDINNLCAALIVFRSMIQFGDNRQMEEPIDKGFISFVNLIQSDQAAVVDQTLQLFVEVSKYIPEVLYSQQNNEKIVDIILQIFNDNGTFSFQNINQAFLILVNLTENIPKYTKNMTKSFKLQTQKFLDIIYRIAFNTTDFFILEQCFTYYFTVIESEQQITEILNYFNNFKEMLIQTAQKSSLDNERDQKIICFIEVILNVIVLKLISDTDGRKKIKEYYKDCIDIYEACKEQINFQKELLTEPFELMCSVLLADPDSKEFQQEVNKFIKDYVLWALKSKDQMELYCKGLTMFLQLVETYHLQMQQNMEEVLLQTLDLVQNKYCLQFNELYQTLLRSVSEYAQYDRQLLLMYFEKIKTLECSIMKEIICNKLKKLKVNDIEQILEVTTLIFELNLNIVHTCCEIGHTFKHYHSFQDLMVILVQFIQKFMQVIRNPGPTLASYMLGNIIDFNNLTFQNERINFNQDFIICLINYLKNYQDQSEVAELFGYIEQSTNTNISSYFQ